MNEDEEGGEHAGGNGHQEAAPDEDEVLAAEAEDGAHGEEQLYRNLRMRRNIGSAELAT